MKYKELEAFETNEFKVGDLVNIYHGRVIHKGIIFCINNDFFTFNEDHLRGMIIHFKQCRKLEPIKPREFWLDTSNKFHGDSGIANPAYKELGESDVTNIDRNRFIKVREVIEG